MKILHYVDENRLAWGESWIQLIKELERQGARSVVVCKPDGTLAQRLTQEGIACETFSPPISWLPQSASGLGRVIDKIRPDIIHTRLSSAARTGGYWGKRKQIPVIQSVDKYPKAHYHKHADLLLPCSTSVKEHMVSLGFAEAKMRIVLNPLETARYKPDPAVRAQTRAALGIGNDTLLITGAGRFVEWKGFDNLISAYADILKRNSLTHGKTRLLLAGDGEEKDRLLKLSRETTVGENIIMPGFVQDIRPYLQASDIFVLPSKTPEPFGIVLLEAMATGLACIATRGGGALDMITDGENGIFAELDSVASLSAALDIACKERNLRERLASKALETAARFDVTCTARQVVSIYQEVLQRSI